MRFVKEVVAQEGFGLDWVCVGEEGMKRWHGVVSLIGEGAGFGFWSFGRPKRLQRPKQIYSEEREGTYFNLWELKTWKGGNGERLGLGCFL